MNLHEHKKDFKNIIDTVVMQEDLAPAIIEKDYFVSLFLEQLVKTNPDIIFKGGTSLSKCYGVIKRFSEDIDLNVMTGTARISEGTRKRLAYLIKDTLTTLGMELRNPEKIASGKDYNRYEIAYDSLYPDEHLKSFLLVETATCIKSYPTHTLPVASIIGQYLQKTGRTDLVSRFALEPFVMQVQSLERTFLDKIFALADYHLADDIPGHSRHLYDLFKLQPQLKLDADLKRLYQEVLLARRPHKRCYSAQKNIDLIGLLQEIYDQAVYKIDYQKKTQYLLYETCEYETAVSVLPRIIEWLK
jgi:predicted nucleotidyltransferase component of viral defense system